MTENKYSAPKASLGDHAISAAKVIGSAVPIVGGPGVELFNWLISPPLERRRQSWMEEVGSKLAELEKRTGVSLEELQNDDRFLDTVLKASQAAVRTSQEEKRAALRNAVLRSAMPHAPDESKQAMFIAWVESLTVWHLRLLGLLAGPREWFAKVGKKPMEYSFAGSISQMIGDAYPELNSDREFLEKIFNDLTSEGLVQRAGLFTVMSGQGPFEKRSTPLGDELLTFITSPL